MAFTKIVDTSGRSWMVVPYVWYDYLLLPVRMFLFAVLYLMVAILMPVANLLQWVVRHPQMQIRDRRDSK